MRSFVTALLLGGTSLGALAAGEAGAQALDRPEQRCLNGNNRGLERVARVQRRENAICVNRGARGRLATTIEACIAGDSRGRVARAQAATARRVPKVCTEPPPFGIVDPTGATANQTAAEREIASLHSIFGPDLDAVIVAREDDRAGHRCQATILRFAARCQDVKLRAFNTCKRLALRGRRAPAAASAEELQDICLGTGLSSFPDPRRRIERRCEDRLLRVTARVCSGLPVSELFPGCAGEALATCVDRSTSCETCLALNAVDGLARDCDALDDQLANGSCGVCTPGQDEPCYSGPPGTLDVGVCRAGTRTCTPLGEWGSCSGQVLPSSEICNGLDDDCNGIVDDNCL